MEQLVARRAHNPKVIGSSPVPATQKEKALIERLRLFCVYDDGSCARISRNGHRFDSCSRYPERESLR